MFKGQPQNKAFFNQNKGPHFGSKINMLFFETTLWKKLIHDWEKPTRVRLVTSDERTSKQKMDRTSYHLLEGCFWMASMTFILRFSMGFAAEVNDMDPDPCWSVWFSQ